MIETGFKNAMQERGVTTNAPIVANGKINRVHVEGDKPRAENGWYVLYDGDPAAGAFGCWKRDIQETWCSREYKTLSGEEKARYRANMEAAKTAREAELHRIQAECREWCNKAWEEAKSATNDNPYLKKKGVNAYGLKSFKGSLIIPVKDMAGTIHGLQFIQPDGTKKFKTGTNKTGHFFTIGKAKDNTLIISEGYATGASIHEATGHCVIVAFDAGNLKLVAEAIRAARPGIKIILAVDDDHATEGNPGLTKATEAARSVNGLLAVPLFPDTRGPKDNDMNDLARLAGPEPVKACIEAAQPPEPVKAETQAKETQEEAVSRLAALSPLQYDKVRKEEAKALGVRPSTLDATIKCARKEEVDDSPFEEVELWPEPVDGAELLTTIAATVRRFIICGPETAYAVALWVVMTWFIDVVQVAPLAVITAPEKRCGKSLLLFLIGRLVPRPLTSSSITPSALFRSIDAWQPTLLIDEVDACLKDNEELRGLINCGHTRDSAFTIRCVGDDHIPKKFNVWGAKALSGIGHVADTLMDRAIVLELRRKLSHESVDRIRYAEPDLFNALCSKLARFADDNSERVRLARPDLPSSLNDRAQDNWEPLLAIAMVAGGDWFKIGTEAALKLSSGKGASQTVGTELLSDIQEIFEEKQVDRISTAELIKALCADEEKPWATYNRGLPIKPRQIAAKLRGYDIYSKNIRLGFGEVPKGYEVNQFKEAFSRYISVTPLTLQSATPTIESATPPQVDVLPVADNPLRSGSVADMNTCKPAPALDCSVVADRTPLSTSEVIDLTGIDFEVIS